MRFKRHASGAFEAIPTQEEIEFAKLKESNKTLTEQNQNLQSSLSALSKLLIDKNLVTEQELTSVVNQISTDKTDSSKEGAE